MGLNIVELEQDERLYNYVLGVLHATTITFENSSVIKITENQKGSALLWVYNTPAIPTQNIKPSK